MIIYSAASRQPKQWLAAKRRNGHEQEHKTAWKFQIKWANMFVADVIIGFLRRFAKDNGDDDDYNNVVYSAAGCCFCPKEREREGDLDAMIYNVIDIDNGAFYQKVRVQLKINHRLPGP